MSGLLLRSALVLALLLQIGCAVSVGANQRVMNGDVLYQQVMDGDIRYVSSENINQRTSSGDTLLMAASRYHPEFITALLNLNADVNARNYSGWTPLMLANSSDATRLLLAAGADVNAQNNSGDTPLISTQNSETTQLLLKAGANVNTRNYLGETALMGAVTEKTNLLIAAGADIDARDNNGLTALMAAARSGRADVVSLLVIAGARRDLVASGGDLYDVRTKHMESLNGMTALDMAQMQGHVSVVKLLEKSVGESKAWQVAQSTNTLSAYQDYLKQYPAGTYQKAAQQRIDELQKDAIQKAQARAALQKKIARQACKLVENDWLYTSRACQNGLAHGQGVAVNEAKNLKFEGRFEQGMRVEGKVSYADTLMYDGSLQDGKPHGAGICMHEGEPEECKYYYGKRVDTLYKVRLETEKQRIALETQQKQIDASLKRNEEAMANMQSRAGGSTSSDPNSIDNMVKREVVKQGVNMLFDQLF